MQPKLRCATALLLSCAFCNAAEYSIPCDLANGLVYLDTKVNDSALLPVVLDSGTSITVFSPSAARLLKSEFIPPLHAAGPGHGKDTSMSVAAGVAIDLGPVRLDDQQVAILPIDYIAQQAGHATAGILTVSAFRNRVVLVDYAAKRVRFIDLSEFTPSSQPVAIPINIVGNTPFAEAEIELFGGKRITGTFLLDSGLTGALLLSKPFLGRHPEILRNDARITWPPIDAVGGAMKIQIGRLASLRLGPLTFSMPTAGFAVDGAGVLNNPQIDGVIGAEILRRFRVAYDYSKHRIFLTPTPALDDPFPLDSSGIRIVTTPPDFHHFVVAGIVQNSPAANIGIKPGDALLSIDGKGAAALTLAEIQRTLTVPDAEHTLSLERGGQRLRVQMKTRSLISSGSR